MNNINIVLKFCSFVIIISKVTLTGLKECVKKASNIKKSNVQESNVVKIPFDGLRLKLIEHILLGIFFELLF